MNNSEFENWWKEYNVEFFFDMAHFGNIKDAWTAVLKWALTHKLSIEEVYNEDGSQVNYVIDTQIIEQELELLYDEERNKTA